MVKYTPKKQERHNINIRGTFNILFNGLKSKICSKSVDDRATKPTVDIKNNEKLKSVSVKNNKSHNFNFIPNNVVKEDNIKRLKKCGSLFVLNDTKSRNYNIKESVSSLSILETSSALKLTPKKSFVKRFITKNNTILSNGPGSPRIPSLYESDRIKRHWANKREKKGKSYESTIKISRLEKICLDSYVYSKDRSLYIKSIIKKEKSNKPKYVGKNNIMEGYSKIDRYDELAIAIKNDDIESFKKGINNITIDSYELDYLLLEAINMKKINFELLDFLLEELKIDVNTTDNLKRTPIHIACSRGDINLVTFLLGNHSNVNCKDIFGFLPLDVCIKLNHFHLIDTLVLFGVDLNKKNGYGHTILHDIMVRDDNMALRKILKYKKKLKINAKSNNKLTPIACGVKHNSALSIVTYLSLCGNIIDLSCTDSKDNNLIHIAAVSGNYHILEIIYNSGIKFDSNLINKKNMRGRTPLHIAVRFNRPNFVKWYLNLANVDMSIKDIDGNTALSLAIKSKNIRIINFIADQ